MQYVANNMLTILHLQSYTILEYNHPIDSYLFSFIDVAIEAPRKQQKEMQVLHSRVSIATQLLRATKYDVLLSSLLTPTLMWYRQTFIHPLDTHRYARTCCTLEFNKSAQGKQDTTQRYKNVLLTLCYIHSKNSLLKTKFIVSFESVSNQSLH